MELKERFDTINKNIVDLKFKKAYLKKELEECNVTQKEDIINNINEIDLKVKELKRELLDVKFNMLFIEGEKENDKYKRK